MDVLKSIHEEGNTIIMVTHNPALTTYATRVIYMLDGHIDTDIKTVDDRDLPQPITVRIEKRKAKQEIIIDPQTESDSDDNSSIDSSNDPDDSKQKLVPGPNSTSDSKTKSTKSNSPKSSKKSSKHKKSRRKN